MRGRLRRGWHGPSAPAVAAPPPPPTYMPASVTLSTGLGRAAAASREGDSGGGATSRGQWLTEARAPARLLQMRRHSPLRSASLGAALALLALAALGVLALAGRATAGPTLAHPLSKRSFFDLQCKGVYDKSIFARLDRICEDCYNLFREPQLHSLCRKNCFTTDYFKGCLDVLLLQDEMDKIQTWIKQLHGADPGV